MLQAPRVPPDLRVLLVSLVLRDLRDRLVPLDQQVLRVLLVLRGLLVLKASLVQLDRKGQRVP